MALKAECGYRRTRYEYAAYNVLRDIPGVPRFHAGHLYGGDQELPGECLQNPLRSSSGPLSIQSVFKIGRYLVEFVY